VINYERTRGISEVWERLKKSNKFKIVLDLTSVNNIYSCGLGAIVKIHKETQEAGGMLVVVGAQAYVKATLDSTKLSRLLRLVTDHRQARELFDSVKKKADEERIRAEEAAKPKVRVPCWQYFKNHNPRNATTCDECFRKINPTNEPCWIVDGVIEGVSFQYVNEDCESCEYFLEYGSA
jgi:anti-anti-sigma factor